MYRYFTDDGIYSLVGCVLRTNTKCTHSCARSYYKNHVTLHNHGIYLNSYIRLLQKLSKGISIILPNFDLRYNYYSFLTTWPLSSVVIAHKYTIVYAHRHCVVIHLAPINQVAPPSHHLIKPIICDSQVYLKISFFLQVYNGMIWNKRRKLNHQKYHEIWNDFFQE